MPGLRQKGLRFWMPASVLSVGKGLGVFDIRKIYLLPALPKRVWGIPEPLLINFVARMYFLQT